MKPLNSICEYSKKLQLKALLVIDDYADTPAGKFRSMIGSLQGNQPNDPVKGAAAIIRLLEADNPPVHAALGADAQGGMRQKLANIEAELSAWEDNAASTTRDPNTF